MSTSVKTWDVVYLLHIIRKGGRRTKQGAVEGAIRLQKLVFLAREEKVPITYRFDAYYFGPYSEEITKDIGFLKDLGFIEVIEETGISSTGKITPKRSYKITKEGLDFLSKYKISEDINERISNIIEEYSSLPVSKIVEEALKRWPIPAK